MSYILGSKFYQQFTSTNISGICANTDTTPWSTLVHNGLDDFTVHVFVTNIDTGRYTISGVIPLTYSAGDSIGVVVSGQVGGNLSKFYIPMGTVDTTFLNAVTLASGGLDQVIIEPNVNLRQATAISSAALAGISSGTGNNIWYQGVNNPNQNRISAVANSGIRTSLNYILP